MHEAIAYLKKRVEALGKETTSVLDEVSRQTERESKTLETMEYGRTFDEERALGQERVVEALHEALEALQGAQDAARDAVRALTKLGSGKPE